MPEIGLLSGSAEEKEYGYAPRSRVYAGPDWGWQTQESYDKIIKEQQSPLGMLKGGIRFISNTYQQASQAFYNAIPEPVSSAIDTVVEPVSKALEQGYAKTPVGMAEEGAIQLGQNLGNTLGNTTLGAAAGFVLGAVIPGPGELNVANGSIRMTRPGSRGKYLTQDEFDIVQPERIRAARDKLDAASETVQNIEESLPGIPKKILKADTKTGYKSAVRKKEDAMAALSSEESNIITPTPENQYAFPRDTARAKEMKGEALKVNTGLGRTLENLEMHHLIPKGISAAVYNRARDFIEKGDGTLEDLYRINNKFKKLTGGDTGDLESNILAMRTTPHSTFHNEMRYQPSSTFPKEKLEISRENLTKRLRKVKNMKELEALLDLFIENDIVPLVTDARNWENMDDLIKSISPKYTGKARYKPKK